MNRTRTRAAVAAAALLALLVPVVSGCSSGGSPPVGVSSQPQGTGSSPAASASGDPLGPAFAERKATVDGTGMTLEMFPIRRSGKVATMTARVTIDDIGERSRVFFHPLSRTATIQDPAPSGFTLVAKEEGKAYLPAEDAAKRPLCSPSLDDAANGDVVIVSCLFGAPAPSTSAVDVQIVNFGNIHAVPLV